MMVEGWNKKQFIQIANNEPFSIGDGDHGLITDKDYIEGGIPLIRIVDLKKNGQLDLTSVKRITKEAHNRVKSSWLKPHDILVSKTGTLGRTCIIPDEIRTANTTSSVAKISLNEDLVNYRYFHQFILSDEFKKQLGLFYTKTAQPGFNNGDFKKFDISFPESLQEQQKIADILTKVDETIEATENIIAKDERIKKGLMQDLFSKGIDEEGNLRSEETHEFKDSDLGRIPKKWDVETISPDFAEITTGNKDTQDRNDKGLYPFFVRSNTIERINSYSYNGKAILTSGDGVGVGKIYHYVNCKFDFHQRVYMLYNFKKDISGKYLFYYFREHFYDEVAKYSAKTTVDSVRLHMIADMLIPKPKHEEQKQIASILSSIDSKIQREKQELNKLKSIKEGLMQDLLTGKVRVNNLLEEAV